MSTKETEQRPTPEEISARAYEIYLRSWEESLSVEHWMAAEKELIEEHAQRESALEPKEVGVGNGVGDKT
jgi:hypothetical protein